MTSRYRHGSLILTYTEIATRRPAEVNAGVQTAATKEEATKRPTKRRSAKFPLKRSAKEHKIVENRMLRTPNELFRERLAKRTSLFPFQTCRSPGSRSPMKRAPRFRISASEPCSVNHTKRLLSLATQSYRPSGGELRSSSKSKKQH